MPWRYQRVGKKGDGGYHRSSRWIGWISRIGPLEFKDGAPSAATADKLYDNLDFTHAYEAFVNTFQGVNAGAIRESFLGIGVKDNELLVFSKLMDASSLFLTAMPTRSIL